MASGEAEGCHGSRAATDGSGAEFRDFFGFAIGGLLPADLGVDLMISCRWFSAQGEIYFHILNEPFFLGILNEPLIPILRGQG